MAEEKYTKYVLEEDTELRIKTNEYEEENIEIELNYGTAEIFGYELKKDVRDTFGKGDKFAIFTFQGCTIHIYGKMAVNPEVSKENPMIMYLQLYVFQRTYLFSIDSMLNIVCIFLYFIRASTLTSTVQHFNRDVFR